MMNDALFLDNWQLLDRFTKKALRDFARNPTERNQCYVVGYLGALSDRAQMPDSGYWLAFVGQLKEGNDCQKAILHSAVE